jgi:hypothetical protein
VWIMRKYREDYGKQIAAALRGCPPLDQESPERDRLWLVVHDLICTRAQRSVTPIGSHASVVVTADYANQELLGAMQWLVRNEATARELAPRDLYLRMRAAATKGSHGSSRAVRADELHGLTHVRKGESLRFQQLEFDDPLAS